jgi:hypothetical protein
VPHLNTMGLARGRRALALLAAAATLATLCVTPGASASTASSPAARGGCAGPSFCIPKTVVLDGTQLALTRALVRVGDPQLRTTLKDLTTQANSYLNQGPWSVMDKTQVPPSGDKHDYLSQAPYFWPTEPATASNPLGCPYVDKDGDVNPAAEDITDHNERGEMFNAVYDLTLAWYYTGNAAYAQRAELDLATWFINPATAMNPNLDYTQGIPCQVDGRGIGIIDFSQQFTDILDATAILDTGAPGWSGADHTSMQSWYSQFLTWLETSPNAADEAASTNNHGSFFDQQEAALALATGQPGLARQIVTTAETKRLDVQLAADGTEPLEISRTRSWHYSNFNLTALTRLAMIGQHVGVNLWTYQTPSGGSILKSIDFLIPAATGATAWTYPELDFQAFAAIDLVHVAAEHGDKAAAAAVSKVQAPPGGDLFPLAPAPEQLDSVVTG